MNQYAKYLIIAALYIVIVFVVFGCYRFFVKRRENKINKSSKINKQGKNRLFLFYKLFMVTPGINKIFTKVLRNTESVYPSDALSVNREATKIMLKSMSFSVIVILISAVTCGGDLLFFLMGGIASAVIFNYNITNTFQNVEYRLLSQMQDFLSQVRHYYLNRGIVEDAIEDTLDSIPYEIGLHMSKIHEILVSPYMDEKVDEYTVSAPNRFFLLLLSICSSVKEYGGDSFLQSLSYLKEEINEEVLKKRAIKEAFAGMQLISLCVVLFLKPAEIWVTHNMPNLEAFYSGSYGKTIMVSTFIAAFGTYYLIDVLKDCKRGELVKNNIFSKIAQIPVFSKLLNQYINKNYTKMRTLNEKMKEVGDQTGPKAFLVRQLLFGLAAFAFMTSTTLVSVTTEKLTMLSNYVADFDSDIVPNEKYKKVMQQASYDYVHIMKEANMYDISEEELADTIINNGVVRNKDYAAIVAQEVIKELNLYKNTYYKWYQFIIAVICALVAFNVPKWFLNFKCKVASMNKEDEMAQFQTLILVLMDVDGIRLDIILEWMDRFAYSFKVTIEDCINSLESGERAALETMKASEDNTSFQCFVDCLMSIDESDVATAFDEILIDRDYSLKERTAKSKISIKKKSSYGSILAFVPSGIVLVGYLIGPMIGNALVMLGEMNFNI